MSTTGLGIAPLGAAVVMSQEDESLATVLRWQTKSFEYARSPDRLLSLMAKGFETMGKILLEDAVNDDVRYALMMLDSQRSCAVRFENNSDEAVRSTMYGFIESVHATLFKLTEKIAAIESSPKDSRESMDQNTQTEEVEDETRSNASLADVEDNSMGFNQAHCSHSTAPSYVAPKEEELLEDAQPIHDRVKISELFDKTDCDSKDVIMLDESNMAGTSFGGNVFQEGNDEYGNEFSHQNSMMSSSSNSRKRKSAQHEDQDPNKTPYLSKRSATQMECPDPNCEFRTDVLPSWISHLYRKHNTTPDLANFAARCECGTLCISNSHSRFCSISNFTVVRIRDGPMRRLAELPTESAEVEASSALSSMKPLEAAGGSGFTSQPPLVDLEADTPKCMIRNCDPSHVTLDDTFPFFLIPCHVNYSNAKEESRPQTMTGYVTHLVRKHNTSLLKEGYYLLCGCGTIGTCKNLCHKHSKEAKSNVRAADGIKRDADGPNEESAAAAAAVAAPPLLNFIDLPAHFLVAHKLTYSEMAAFRLTCRKALDAVDHCGRTHHTLDVTRLVGELWPEKRSQDDPHFAFLVGQAHVLAGPRPDQLDRFRRHRSARRFPAGSRVTPRRNVKTLSLIGAVAGPNVWAALARLFPGVRNVRFTEAVAHFPDEIVHEVAARGVMAADIFVEQQALEQNGQLDAQRVLSLRCLKRLFPAARAMYVD
ncbi:hypothetical protein PRIPAC_87454 [Pristionchus pacificus]|uniref:Uncharacterized protein n=1 Tax=Pristionchus pacificus TaxID=54126 RepID=A0A2A6CX58_PRIPA|nr:hypothetical protein PRIPAC_87454 [Pristionchus pacificus]|eukprot:PDM82680.1 hypothetical protein PRIPAC_37073 [Pristionchus pacificus]